MKMGPYCNYCGNRCFLQRSLPHNNAMTILMATCYEGQQNDLERTGYTFQTAINTWNDFDVTVFNWED